MSVTSAKGFRAAGIAAGIKDSGKPDLALVVNDGPQTAAAGVFTSNRVKAAPVVWSEQVLKGGAVKAVILNSGGANACTGPAGFQDTHKTAEETAALLDASAAEIAVCSTGLIGVRLPMDALLSGLKTAAVALAADGGPAAATAIMTTDTVAKTAEAHGSGYVVGGMAKGAGMLAPGLATMLVVLTTDAVADAEVLDTVLLRASGASGKAPEQAEFQGVLNQVCASLARQLIGDAEGATKDIAVEVTRARTEEEALEVARAVTRSNLFKCAMYGNDPNWGRILSAVGTTQAAFEPDQVSVAINDVWICRNGGVGDDRDLVDLTGREVRVLIDLGAGDDTATVWTNDLTPGYVHENSAYSS